MIQILKSNQKVLAETSGNVCEVEQFLGSGGQGEVYKANLGGKPVALKWYYSVSATPHQRASLEALIKEDPPDERFLWPMDLVSAPGIQGFGYVMSLRDPSYKGIVDLMKRRVDPTFHALSKLGFNLADSFLQLHAKGWCYRDISFGNVFFDPQTGSILICDNDNIAINGDKNCGVTGTPFFMAPEIVRREALPSTNTDLFSMAVLLFYILIMHHPLDGKKEAAIHSLDPAAMDKLYGKEPVFIYDPNNDSNRPVPGIHDNALILWQLYPRFLRDLFTRSFTEGIRNPENGRVRESEWRVSMVRLHDSIFYCSICGAENIYDVEVLRASNGKPNPCWACKKDTKLPLRMRIGRNLIMLNHDTRIFSHHITQQNGYDFSKAMAVVSRHPNNAQIWGLKNLSTKQWTAKVDGKEKDVTPGQSISLATGIKINFGKIEGEIRN